MTHRNNAADEKLFPLWQNHNVLWKSVHFYMLLDTITNEKLKLLPFMTKISFTLEINTFALYALKLQQVSVDLNQHFIYL